VIPARVAIYAAVAPIDLRRSFDGLAAAARDTLGDDPRSGALFLFFNRARDRMKVLWYDRTGFCLLYKRLDRGTFRMPGPLDPSDRRVQIDAAELAKILEGIDLPRVRRAA
jgi:transposase